MFSWFKKKDIRKIKLVCFDLDNTLLDYSTAEAITEARMMELILKDIMSASHLMKRSAKKGPMRYPLKDPISAFKLLSIYNGIKQQHMSRGYDDFSIKRYSRAVWFAETFERLKDDLDANTVMKLSKKADAYERRYWESIMDNMKPYQHTKEVLDYLKGLGIKLATITDSDGKPGIKKERLERTGLSHYFDYIILTDDTGSIKPAKINWERLLQQSGLRAEECMMVGDHPEIDLITAKKLGFMTVWTKQSIGTSLRERYVDHEIHDIDEIIDIVRKINRD